MTRGLLPAETSDKTEETTEECVSISLPDLLEELIHRAVGECREKLVLLSRRARANTMPAQTVKHEMVMLVGAVAIREAVSGLVAKRTGRKAAEGTVSEPSCAPEPTPVPADTSISPMFNCMHKEEFRMSLVHAFHCRTPSCPVPQCANLHERLERLHRHVSSCSAETCVLCQMWRSLNDYCEDCGPPAAPASQTEAKNTTSPKSESTISSRTAPHSPTLLYEDQLLSSSQPLPCWQNGHVSWATPREAIARVHAISRGDNADPPSTEASTSTDVPPLEAAIKPTADQPSIDWLHEPASKRVRVASVPSVGRDRSRQKTSMVATAQRTLRVPTTQDDSNFINFGGHSSTQDPLVPSDADFSKLFADQVQALPAAGPDDEMPPLPQTRNDSLLFEGMLGNVALAEITSSSLNEVLKVTSAADLASLLMSPGRRPGDLKSRNVSEMSLGAFDAQQSCNLIQSEGMREILAEFGY